MSPSRAQHYRFIALAVAILLLALLLRLRGLDTTGLWGDQAFTLNTAMRWVNGGPLPLAANKSSVGFVNPPLIEYLYGAALFLWRDILSVSLLTLLGGLVAVGVTGAVTARLFGRRAALWAMLAFAAAPWAVFWSQLIWNQTLVPPFAALALGGLLLYLFDRPRALYLVGCFAATAAMIQVHPGSAVQLLTIAVALLVYRRRVRPAHVVVGAAVFALLFLPYLLYQIGTGWADLAAIRATAGQAAAFSSAALRLSFDLIRAQGLYRAVPGVEAFDALATGLFVVALGVVVGRVFWERRGAGERGGRGGRNSAAPSPLPNPLPQGEGVRSCSPAPLLLLWFAVPLLFYWRSGVYLQNYYLISQWPAHFVILGIGLDTLQRAVERWPGRERLGRVVTWLLPWPLLALVAFQVLFSLRYQDARAAGDGPPLQVRHARALIDQSRRLLAERPECRLVGLGHGESVDNSDLALLVEFTDPARVLLADGDLALPLPSPCAVTLDARPGSRASYALAAQAQPIPDASVTVKDQPWQFYDWREGPRGETAGAPRWDDVSLIGVFRGDAVPGQNLTFVLTWEIAARPAAAYHFGLYLLDAANGVAGQHDGPGFDSAQWRPGDRFVTFHPLPLPPDLPAGEYRAGVALYTWPDIVRAPLRDGADMATADEQVVVPP
jgi:hypothetical protein